MSGPGESIAVMMNGSGNEKEPVLSRWTEDVEVGNVGTLVSVWSLTRQHDHCWASLFMCWVAIP